MFKRNQIVQTASVQEGREPEFCMFGRIVKTLPDNKYLVVSCGKNFEVLPATHLRPAMDSDGKPYTGYWATAESLYADWKIEKYGYFGNKTLPTHMVFEKMPSLRRLKQLATMYNLVWRKQKLTRQEKYFAKLDG